MRDGLRAIQQNFRAHTARALDDLFGGSDDPKRVRYLRERNQLRPGAKEFSIGVQQDLAGVIHWHNFQARALFGSQLLPGNNIGVMLQPSDQDFVTRTDVLPAPTLRNQIDSLSGAADEDDFLRGRRVQEPAHLVSGLLVRIRGARGKLVGGAMNIRVLVFVEILQTIDY